jgi:hypothetical protein
MRASVVSLVAGAAGILGGVLGSLVISSRNQPREAPPAASAAPAPQPASVEYVRVEPQLRLPESLPPSVVTPVTPDAGVAPAPVVQQPQTEPQPIAAGEIPSGARSAKEYFEESLRAHAEEAVNPEWSTAGNSRLAADFSALTREGGDMTFVRADCRSRSCVVTLEWSDYAHAHQDADRLLYRTYAVNCQNTVLMSPPDNPTARYQSQMLLECAHPETAMQE